MGLILLVRFRRLQPARPKPWVFNRQERQIGPWEEQGSNSGQAADKGTWRQYPNTLTEIESTKSVLSIVQIRGTGQARLKEKSTTTA